MLSSIIFILVLGVAIILFTRKIKKISREINLGRDIQIDDNKPLRWKQMLFIAIGQQKMLDRPIAALMHIFVYVGFIIVNIEMLEILTDGVLGSHRAFSFIGNGYPILISAFEFVALAVIFGCVVFLVRRNVLRVNRFWNEEMKIWPRTDANIILITEIFLMSSILIMNATDGILQMQPDSHYVQVGSFAVSGMIQPLFAGMSVDALTFVERFCWWFHIIGVMAFLNYIPYSKHFHVFLSFPNVYYSKLGPKGEMVNMPAVTREVKLMLEENYSEPAGEEEPLLLGAKDVRELTWKHLMDAYSCTECGRCTSRCPANMTGKKLSPRKIVMDTRDRLEEIGRALHRKSKDEKLNYDDGKSLFDYISTEELWACTTCNACTQECPVNIDPMAIILEMRRHLVMERSEAPVPLNSMFANIENNGAPWQYSPEDRLQWVEK